MFRCREEMGAYLLAEVCRERRSITSSMGTKMPPCLTPQAGILHQVNELPSSADVLCLDSSNCHCFSGKSKVVVTDLTSSQALLECSCHIVLHTMLLLFLSP